MLHLRISTKSHVSTGRLSLLLRPVLKWVPITALSTLIFTLFLCACASTEQPVVVPSVRQDWDKAVALAQEWQSDAYVLEAHASFYEEYDSQFHFRSNNSPNSFLLVTCHSGACAEAESEFESVPPLPGCAPIHYRDFTLDSEDALRIALEQGGSAYFSDAPHTRTVLVLSRGFPTCTDTVHWRATFYDLSTSEGVTIHLDAVSGAVLD